MALFFRTDGKCATRIIGGKCFFGGVFLLVFFQGVRLATNLLRVLLLLCAEKDHYRQCIATA